jgi:serine/threonine protein kinase
MSFSSCFQSERKYVIVMELCERGSLLDLIRKPENITGIDEDELLRVFSHLGNCLNIIHHFE